MVYMQKTLDGKEITDEKRDEDRNSPYLRKTGILIDEKEDEGNPFPFDVFGLHGLSAQEAWKHLHCHE